MAELSLQRGIDRRNRGIEATMDSNERFLRDARQHAVQVARLNGTVSIDDIRVWADRLETGPKVPNAWGSLFKKCPLPGMRFECIGYKASSYPSNNARAIGVYRVVPKKVAA